MSGHSTTNSTQRRRPRLSGGAARRRSGTTLIEVVCASVILAIAVTMIASSVAAVTMADIRARQRLEALELANRLLLQFLDDKEAMPSESAHLESGLGTYKYKLVESPIGLSFPEGSVFEASENQSRKVMDQTKLVSVTVWAATPDGVGGYTAGEQMATLARINNPLSVLSRNPDTMARIASDPSRLMAMVMKMIEDGSIPTASGSGSGGGSGSGSSSSSSGSGSSSAGSARGSSRGSPFDGATTGRGK